MRTNNILRASLALALTASALPADSINDVSAESASKKLPIIDLGYELHQAINYSSTSDAYKFQNIRYAQAPTGELRFRAPLSPKIDRRQVQNGTGPSSCPNGIPAWQAKASMITDGYTRGKPYSLEIMEADFAAAQDPHLNLTIGNTEDCLKLDVYSPRKAFQVASKLSLPWQPKQCAPVLVWIHGGGWVIGNKNTKFDPTDMLTWAQQSNELGMVFVALNYRLGALGYMGGSQIEKDGDFNAGLLDQRLALEWVQKHIHQFGGCADRVTVMGESAGAGSILLQILAYGKQKGKQLFHQVIPQSVGGLPPYKAPQSIYDDFLTQLNVTTIQEARKISETDIIQGNAQLLAKLPAAGYRYVPTVDGSFFQGAPEHQLAQGKYDKDLKVLVGRNSFEGGMFFDASVKTEEDFKRYLKNTSPGLTDAMVEETASSIYPPIFDGSQGYIDQATRQIAVFGESGFNCHAELVNKYFKDSYSYEFSIPPGFHVQDTDYTFTDNTDKIPAPYPEARANHQKMLVSFVLNGSPSFNGANGATLIPHWDATTRAVANVTKEGIVLGNRPAINQTRCDWWTIKTPSMVFQ